MHGLAQGRIEPRGDVALVVALVANESRVLQPALRRARTYPGNLRTVVDYEADSFVVRRPEYLASLDARVEPGELVAWLSIRGGKVVYTPDASVSARQPPLVRPYLTAAFRHGAARGRAARRTRGRSISAATAFSFAPAAGAVLGVAFLAVGARLWEPGLVLVLVYAAALVISGIRAGIRFRSLAVGLLEPPAIVPSQSAYLAGFARGLATGARSDSRVPRGRAGAEGGPPTLRRPQERS